MRDVTVTFSVQGTLEDNNSVVFSQDLIGEVIVKDLDGNIIKSYEPNKDCVRFNGVIDVYANGVNK